MPDPLPDSPWNRIRAELRRAVSDTTWRLWLQRLELYELAGDVLRLEAPDNVRSWVGDRYGRLLRACAATVLGPGARVELVAPGTAVPVPGQAGRSGARDWTPSTLNPRLTFDQFVIGDANRLAHAAALAVAELPGLAYNPLFICGTPGLGKTHLLQAIGNYVQAYEPMQTVRYTTAEAFTNQFTGAVQTKGAAMDAFKAAYRHVDLLLVDDVQFLRAKVRTEEEFFHTFNAVHETGAQLVLSSDRPPQRLEGMMDRLRARFEAGLVVELLPPDIATRTTILRKRIAQDELRDVDDDAVALIAGRVTGSVRVLEGALIRVVAFASLTGRPVTGALADEVLAGLYPEAKRAAPTVPEIQQRTSDAFGVPLDALTSTSRAAQVAWARQVAMYLARELTDATLPAIGAAFGRNHTTVMHACKRTAQRIADDRSAFDAVHRLTRELGG